MASARDQLFHYNLPRHVIFGLYMYHYHYRKEYFDWIRKQKKRIFLAPTGVQGVSIFVCLSIFCFGLQINSITIANERCKSSVHFIKFLKSSHWSSSPIIGHYVLSFVVKSSHWSSCPPWHNDTTTYHIYLLRLVLHCHEILQWLNPNQFYVFKEMKNQILLI